MLAALADNSRSVPSTPTEQCPNPCYSKSTEDITFVVFLMCTLLDLVFSPAFDFVPFLSKFPMLSAIKQSYASCWMCMLCKRRSLCLSNLTLQASHPRPFLFLQVSVAPPCRLLSCQDCVWRLFPYFPSSLPFTTFRTHCHPLATSKLWVNGDDTALLAEGASILWILAKDRV